MSCGYVFEERKRFTRPSRCPRCKKTHIETPVYRLT
jgi:predicted Zn-ribbon and HTH transcriptional regulator